MWSSLGDFSGWRVVGWVRNFPDHWATAQQDLRPKCHHVYFSAPFIKQRRRDWTSHLLKKLVVVGLVSKQNAKAENPKYDLKNQRLQHCTFQAPFCTRQQARKEKASSRSCTVIYLLFDSHSLRAKSAVETRFRVQTIPEVNQNLHDFTRFLDKSHKISDVQTVWFQVHKSLDPQTLQIN